jgi:hypothetical protein
MDHLCGYVSNGFVGTLISGQQSNRSVRVRLRIAPRGQFKAKVAIPSLIVNQLCFTHALRDRRRSNHRHAHQPRHGSRQQDKITPSLYREVVGLVVRSRISMERLGLERARFDLDVADLVMKHLDKSKASGVLEVEDRTEAARKIRESIFGKYTKEQLDAAALASA